MKTSNEWIQHFRNNATINRVDWSLKPTITTEEITAILPSLQAWQLGETSDGAHLIAASSLYAEKLGDMDYIEAVKLFIKEEQKHGGNLGRYLDTIAKPRVESNWGDTLFRKIRYFNTNMEIWTLAVITVESAAQVFYQCLKDATHCKLLKQICTDILIDEAYHIDFQVERMEMVFMSKSPLTRFVSRCIYPVFFFSTALVVWYAHNGLFEAGGTGFQKYMHKMKYKYFKTLHRITFGNTKSGILSIFGFGNKRSMGAFPS
jgi:hypothetical protein